MLPYRRPCRPCRRQKLLGTPQESMQLIKYAHPSSSVTHPKLILTTPTYVGAFSQRFIHQHLPNLFHQARQEGNRVIDPLSNFAAEFQNYGDEQYYALALDWVLTRVAFFAKNDPSLGSSFNSFSPYATGRGVYGAGGGQHWGLNPHNVMQDFYIDMLDAFNMGDLQTAHERLDRAVGILGAISNVLKSETGTSYSDQLMEEYLSTVQPFVTWASNMDPYYTFCLLKAAYLATSRDPMAVMRMCNNIGPFDRQVVRDEAMQDAMMNNDRISAEVAQFIP